MYKVMLTSASDSFGVDLQIILVACHLLSTR